MATQPVDNVTVTLAVTINGQVWTDTAQITATVKQLESFEITKDGEPVGDTISFKLPTVFGIELTPWDAWVQNVSVASSNTKIATVSYDPLNQTITVTPLKDGTATISVDIDGIHREFSSVISDISSVIHVDSIDIKDGNTSVNSVSISGTKQLNVAISPANATDKNVVLVVGDNKIISASYNQSTGKITINQLAVGTTTLKATVDGKSKTITVTTTSVTLTDFRITKNTTVVTSDSITAKTVYDITFVPADASGNIVATSSSSSIATVTANDTNKTITVTPMGNGSSTITVKVGNITKTLTISVSGMITSNPLTSIDIKDGTTSVSSATVSALKEFNVAFNPNDGTYTAGSVSVSGYDGNIISATYNESTKILSVTPLKAGTTTLTLTIGGVSDTLSVTVPPVLASSLSIEYGGSGISSDTLTIGKTYTVVLTPSNVTDKTITATSSNASVATVTVNGLNFTVTPLSPGTTTITVTNAASGKSDTLSITVSPVLASSLSIEYNGSGISNDTISAPKAYSVVLSPTNVTNKTITATSSNTAVATVSVSNLTITVTPLTPGTTTITVTNAASGKTDTLAITVSPFLASSISITSGGSSISSDTLLTSKTYDVIFNPTNTTDKTITAVSSNTSVATVSVSGQSFTVNPVTDGTTTVTVTNAASGKTDTLTVTVSGLKVTSINVKDGTTTITSLTLSSAKTLNVEILPSTALNKTIAATVANTNIATVTIDNVAKTLTVTPKSVGNTTLTVTVDGVSQIYNVTVSSIAVTGISISGSSADLLTSRTLSAVFTPSNATNKGVVWSTSNASIIKISSTTGSSITITAVGNGTATITAKSAENNAIKATITIRSDVGLFVTELPLNALILDNGIVYRLVDKQQPYGTGYTKQTNFSVPTTAYYTFIAQTNIGNRAWNTASGDVANYSTSTIHTYLETTWLGTLSDTFDNNLVRVNVPFISFSSTTSTVPAMAFLPSLKELGYTNWDEYPVIEGASFFAFSGTNPPASFGTTGSWTRTRRIDYTQSRDMDKAIIYFSGTSANRVLLTSSYQIHPVINLLTSFKVSYYKDSNGYYVVR